MKPIPAVARDIHVPCVQIQRKTSAIIHNPIQSWPTRFSHSNVCYLLFFFMLPCSGSTVAIWLNPYGIVVAADSLEIQEFGTSRTEVMTCKIHAAEKFYIAATGMQRTNTPGRPTEILFSAVGIARSLADSSSSVKELMGRFIEATAPQFQVVMAQWLRQDPARFMSDVNGKDGALAVAIFQMTERGPVVGIVSFTATTVLTGGLRVGHSPPKFCPDECDLSQGVRGRLGSQVIETGPIPVGMDAAIPWVAKIVQSEIAADKERFERDNSKPRTVGGPISMLALTSSVTRWVDGYHETCPEN